MLYRSKMGFSVPLAKWFRGPLKQRVRKALTDGGLVESGLFNTDYLETLVDQHHSGVRDHSTVLWALMMFEATMRDEPLAVTS